MATEFVMPKLGLTMEEGTILRWLVDEGGDVSVGTPVLSIETDKVESDVEANAAGRLHRLGEEGQTFRCGETIAVLLSPGEVAATPASQPAVADAGAATIVTAAASSPGAPPRPTGFNGSRQFVSPNARRLAAERGIDLLRVVGTGPGGRVVAADLDDLAAAPAPAAVAAPAAPRPAGQPVPATAAARMLADLLGVDLAVVEPDPVDGYVTRESVARYVRMRLRAEPVVASPTSSTQTPVRVKRLSGMRGTIAKRMTASLREMAQLTLTMDAEMDAVVADRAARATDGSPPSYTDYVIAAAARALVAHPDLNAQVTPDGIAILPDVHVGMAVAVEGGLLVPVVRHADALALGEIATTTTRLATAARTGSLGLDDLEGGTFSVTALGMFGVDSFTPVINPPNAAILGVGRLRDDVTVADGQIVVVKRMTLSLTWDHRVVDGAPAALFCKAIVDSLARPADLG